MLGLGCRYSKLNKEEGWKNHRCFPWREADSWNAWQVAVSSVGPEERLLIVPTRHPGVLRCVARYGYQDRVNHGTAFVADMLTQVCHSLFICVRGIRVNEKPEIQI